MGNPFLFADRFSGAVVHLTTDRCFFAAVLLHYFETTLLKTGYWQNEKCPRQLN
jgi:hypothetical protein